jgi:type II pantothenate kinase
LQSEKHQVKHIYFGGSFIRGHRQTMNTLSYAIRFWSKGEKQAYFLRHEGYLGAVGAFIRRQPQNWGRRNSVDEVVAPQAVRNLVTNNNGLNQQHTRSSSES